MNDPIVCARCELPLEFVGTREFHEGTRCGRVELFIDGIGEELRPHLTS